MWYSIYSVLMMVSSCRSNVVFITSISCRLVSVTDSIFESLLFVFESVWILLLFASSFAEKNLYRLSTTYFICVTNDLVEAQKQLDHCYESTWTTAMKARRSLPLRTIEEWTYCFESNSIVALLVSWYWLVDMIFMHVRVFISYCIPLFEWNVERSIKANCWRYLSSISCVLSGFLWSYLKTHICKKQTYGCHEFEIVAQSSMFGDKILLFEFWFEFM